MNCKNTEHETIAVLNYIRDEQPPFVHRII